MWTGPSILSFHSTKDSTANPGATVPRLFAILMRPSAEVVLIGMDDESPAPEVGWRHAFQEIRVS